MSTSVGMVIECITTIVIKLVNKTERYRAYNFEGKCRHKVPTGCLICEIRSGKIGTCIHQYEYDGCYQ